MSTFTHMWRLITHMRTFMTSTINTRMDRMIHRSRIRILTHISIITSRWCTATHIIPTFIIDTITERRNSCQLAP